MKSLVLAAVLAAVALPALAQSQSTPPANGATSSSSAPASADPANARAAVGAACAADFKAQCPNNAPGSDEMKQCVRENFDKLTDACKSAIMAMMAAGGGGER